jgi:hypothetical protein
MPTPNPNISAVRPRKPPADGTLAARCPREVFGTILVAAMPLQRKLHLTR